MSFHLFDDPPIRTPAVKQVYVSMVEVDNYVRVWTISAVRLLVTAKVV